MASRFIPAVLAASVLVLAACSAEPTQEGEADERIQVVASTNVYGDIVSTIGGDAVSVTSIISSPAQDPHSFEASAQHQLAISRADVVVQNGGGYDPFIDTLIDGSGSQAVLISATELGEHEHEGAEDAAVEENADETDEHADEEHADDEHGHDEHGHDHSVNEHVWYDLHLVSEFAHELSHVLGDLDPGSADVFHDNYEAFAASIEQLEAELADIAPSSTGIVVTEPVPLFLLEDAGFVNLTPDEFTEAIEEGSDVPPRSLQETLGLFDQEIALLAYNDQTTSAETERVRDAAEAAGVPVVLFTETLPEGEDYLSWMTANVEAIAGATGR